MTLGSLSEADELRHQQETEAALQNLLGFKPEDLTAVQQLNYQLLQRDLEQTSAMNEYMPLQISVRAEPRLDRRVKSELPRVPHGNGRTRR